MPIILNDRYKIIKSLGSGNFGEAFLAEDTQMPLQQSCVIKQLKPQVNNPQLYQIVKDRFKQEAATLQNLGDHNQIPRLYAYFEDGGEFYLVQEYINGESLEAKVQREGKLSESSVREILSSLLRVIDYIHGHKIVHRDIKPDNIILRQSDGKPVLIDFGAVKEAMSTQINSQGNTVNSIVIGTPGFMASEQAAGRPVYSSDLYSLGVTAIYLITGKLPHDLTTDLMTGEIVWRHQEADISANLADVLDKAVRSHARDRYPTAIEMLYALEAPTKVQPNNAPTMLSPTPIPSAPTLLPSKNRQFLALSSVVFLLVLGIGMRSLPYLWKQKLQTSSITIGTLGDPKDSADLADYLQKEFIPTNFIHFFWGKRVQVLIDGNKSLSYQTAKNKIAKKQWDIAFTLSPIISIAAKDNGYTFAAQMFPDEPPYYNSALYVKADSIIQSLNDITPGTVIALGGFSSASSFYLPVYDLYGKTITVDMGNRGQDIREMVRTGKADMGAGAFGDTVNNDPDIRIIHLSRDIPGSGVYISSELSESDKKAIQSVLMKANKKIQKQANYGAGIEPDYTAFKEVIQRVEEVLSCSDFSKNPVNLFCANDFVTFPRRVINNGIAIVGKVNGWKRPNADTVWLTLIGQDNQIYRVVVSTQILNQVPGATNVLELQNQKIKIIGLKPKPINDSMLELNISDSSQMEVL